MAEDKKSTTDLNVDTSGLKTGEKFVYTRDDKGRVTEVRKEAVKTDSGGCWIATAYYGDPLHCEVCTLRNKRNSLMEKPYIGFFVTVINNLYQFIGKSHFGKDWAKKAGREGTIQNSMSAFICKSLLKISK